MMVRSPQALGPIALAATLVTGALLTAGAPAGAASADHQISYLGLRLEVPVGWPVVTLSPTTCVRFDRHVVYLGTPGTQQNCPPNIVGRAEALLIEPAPAGITTTTGSDDTVSRIITVTTPTARITAPYDQDRGTVATALASAGLPVAAPRSTAAPAPQARLQTTALAATATNGSGEGFDTCQAPAISAMSAWLRASPYRNVGIYLGGADAACATQTNLSASWVTQAYGQGWHFLPIYVGQEAVLNDITNGPVNGRQDADQAVTRAESLGFAPGSVLYYDMEAYHPNQRGPALALEAAWTAELHRLGFLSGIYSSADSGIADIVANAGGTSTPDVVWTARYNGQANTTDSALPADYFTGHQRVHQYSGGNSLTYGKVTLDVDSDYLDVGVSGEAIPAPRTGGLVSVPPTRILDTRSAIGVSTRTPLGAGGTLRLPITGTHGVPGDVLAVVLNVTAVDPSAATYLTVFPDGDPLPTASDINATAGATVPNLVVVPLVDGAVAIYNHAGSVHVLADLFGYYAASGGQTYHRVTPTRILDTRDGTGAPRAPLGAHRILPMPITGGALQIPANASAVIMNVTVVNPTTSGFLAVYPSAATAVPTVSNLNFTRGQTVANLVVVPVSDGSVDIDNDSGATDVVGDVMGYFTPDISRQFTPMSPIRLLDTRSGTGAAVGPIGPGGTLRLAVGGTAGIPTDIDAVVLNVTAVNPTAAGYLTVWPDGQPRPAVSNIDFPPGDTTANLVVVPVTNGSVDVYNHAGDTHVLADVAGYYVG